MEEVDGLGWACNHGETKRRVLDSFKGGEKCFGGTQVPRRPYSVLDTILIICEFELNMICLF